MADKTPLELARDLLERQRAATSQHRALASVERIADDLAEQRIKGTPHPEGLAPVGIVRMSERKPLDLAREIIDRQYDHFTNGRPDGLVAGGIAKTVAAALVERMTPMIVEAPRICPNCYEDCLERRLAPKFCPECGKPLVWK